MPLARYIGDCEVYDTEITIGNDTIGTDEIGYAPFSFVNHFDHGLYPELRI